MLTRRHFVHARPPFGRASGCRSLRDSVSAVHQSSAHKAACSSWYRKRTLAATFATQPKWLDASKSSRKTGKNFQSGLSHLRGFTPGERCFVLMRSSSAASYSRYGGPFSVGLLNSMDRFRHLRPTSHHELLVLIREMWPRMFGKHSGGSHLIFAGKRTSQ